LLSNEPGLDQRLALPQSVAHVLNRAVDADRDLDLSRGHHLGLHAADVPDYISELRLRRPLIEVMMCKPHRVDVSPAERRRHRLGFLHGPT
jgi:hypothetical protein